MDTDGRSADEIAYIRGTDHKVDHGIRKGRSHCLDDRPHGSRMIAAAQRYENGLDAPVTANTCATVSFGEGTSQEAEPAPNEKHCLPRHEVSVRFGPRAQSRINEEIARKSAIREVVDDNPTTPESSGLMKPGRPQGVVVEQDGGEWASGCRQLLGQSGPDHAHLAARRPCDTHDMIPTGFKRLIGIAFTLARREPRLHPMAHELLGQCETAHDMTHPDGRRTVDPDQYSPGFRVPWCQLSVHRATSATVVTTRSTSPSVIAGCSGIVTARA